MTTDIREVFSKNSDEQKLAQAQYNALIAGCHSGYVGRWTPELHTAIFQSFLTGQKLTEPQITRVLIAICYTSALPITKVITDALGANAEDYMPVHPREAHVKPSYERRSIDCAFIAATAVTQVKKIFAEIKFNASVNGRWGYCRFHVPYSNQLICYPGECWTTVPRRERLMVWIGPKRYQTEDWRARLKGAIVPKDVEERDFTQHSLDAQLASDWDAYIALEELRDAAMTGDAAARAFGVLLDNALKAL